MPVALYISNLEQDTRGYEAWLRIVQRLSGADFTYYAEHYSFSTAFSEGVSPREAYEDCRDWMEA